MNWLVNLFEARREMVAWRNEYDQEQPHNRLGVLNTRRIRARNVQAIRPFLQQL